MYACQTLGLLEIVNATQHIFSLQSIQMSKFRLADTELLVTSVTYLYYGLLTR